MMIVVYSLHELYSTNKPNKDIFDDNLTHKISNEEGVLGVSYIES